MKVASKSIFSALFLFIYLFTEIKRKLDLFSEPVLLFVTQEKKKSSGM
jgi:hypothetical protein